MTKPKTKQTLTGRDFDALPHAQKERIFQELEAKSTEQLLAESRPLSRKERAECYPKRTCVRFVNLA
jgi:hypothetical protein